LEGQQGEKRGSIRVIPTETYFALVRQMLADNGQARVRVTGDSMRPVFRHLRDSVLLVPAERIRPGDVVLFDRQNGRYALHRVIGTGKRGFTMMGDNQRHIERNLPYDQVVGVVRALYRDDQYISTETFFWKKFSFAARLSAYPRMYIWTAARGLWRVLKRFRTGAKKHENP